METLIRIGGAYNIALILFHLSFWRIFNWNEELGRVSFLNGAVMQVLNISLMFTFAIFAYISLVHSGELLNSPLGNSLLVLMVLFWLARSVQQVVFFKLHNWLSWLFLLLFVTGFLLYAIPAAALI